MRVTGSMVAPQLPQNLSPTGTAPRQLGQARVAMVGAAPIGVTVIGAGAVGASGGATAVAVVEAGDSAASLCSSPPVAFLSSRSPSPIALPSSGNLPGPKISRTITRITIR